MNPKSKTALVERVRERIAADIDELGYRTTGHADLLALCDLAESAQQSLNDLYEGRSVVLPKTPKHAAEMITVAEACGGFKKSPDNWLPIESAPRDGTFVLCAEPSGHIHILQYCRGGYWRRHVDDTSIWNPTHWQPLPTGPKA